MIEQARAYWIFRLTDMTHWTKIFTVTSAWLSKGCQRATGNDNKRGPHD
jgi:hypothetical protein